MHSKHKKTKGNPHNKPKGNLCTEGIRDVVCNVCCHTADCTTTAWSVLSFKVDHSQTSIHSRSDSTRIAPSKTSGFLIFSSFNERFTAARHKEGYRLLKKKQPYIFLCAKFYRSMTSRCRGTPHFGRYNRELVFETADFAKEKLGRLPWNDS